jgi:hypothetical protein
MFFEFHLKIKGGDGALDDKDFCKGIAGTQHRAP